MSAWNPVDLDQMALPPCHMFCQFYVENGYLSCLMYQRSADMGLGVPFNIASYSLLTRIIAQCAGLRAYKFIHVIGDAHVYTNHIDALTQQIDRKPRPFPKLKIDPTITDIDSFTYESFELIGYDPHDAIPMEMVV
jgi:dihydrofolate reductase/thymidylate synthase